MNPLGFEKTIRASMAIAEDRVTAALQAKGFGVLTKIDFASKMKEKLNKDVRATIILGACNPSLAYEAYSQDQNMLLLIPCNVTLVQISDTEVKVSMIRPSALIKFLEKPILETMAKQVDDILDLTIHSL